MKKEEILEGKVLICKFLDWDIIENEFTRCPNLYPFYNINDDGNTGWFETHLDNIPFETLLDWLHPVLKKIESQGCIIEVSMALGRLCKIKPVNAMGVMFCTESMNLAEAIFSCCVEYIKWYNEKPNGKSN